MRKIIRFCDIHIRDPFIYHTEQYCEPISHSDNGSVLGNWIYDDRLLFEKDGGHGVLFTSLDEELMFIQHIY